jgi:hypothetical protein
MSEFISVKEMMDNIRSGAVFSLRFVTFDFKKGRGGAVKEYLKATLHRQGRGAEKETKEVILYNIKNPNHFENGTINIKILATNEIKKVHVMLIRNFNGATVK